MFGKEMISYKDELYWVYRKVKVEQVSDATILKEFWLCDISLKNGEWILFCRHIPEAQIIE
jgi:hypothetical protein